jgi:Flp pilus assembly protein TadB
MLCKYKDILGIPNKGIHFHVFNIAIIDVLMTIIGAYLISYFFHYNFWLVLIILFLLGIILHRVFCVKTTIDKIIFL